MTCKWALWRAQTRACGHAASQLSLKYYILQFIDCSVCLFSFFFYVWPFSNFYQSYLKTPSVNGVTSDLETIYFKSQDLSFLHFLLHLVL